MRVSVVATGIDINTPQMVLPTMLDLAENLDSSIEVRSQPEEGFLDTEALKKESESNEEDSKAIDSALDSTNEILESYNAALDLAIATEDTAGSIPIISEILSKL